MKTATLGVGFELAAEWKAPLPISKGEYHRCAYCVGMCAGRGFTSSGGERRIRGGDWVSADLGKWIIEASSKTLGVLRSILRVLIKLPSTRRHIGGHHQAITLRNARRSQRLFFFQRAAQGFAVQPIARRTA